MEQTVWSYITEQALIREGQNIGAAVSGGPDSMALLVCLCTLAREHPFTAYCVHFEHGIRGESSVADAEFVADFCETHHVPLFMGAADVPALGREWGLSEETAAKRAREEYFGSLIKNGDLDAVATAHHREDNAESVLMHILRGSSLSGLQGIHPRYGGMIRPFLCLGKRQVMRYIDERGIPYVMDETNANNRYRRNYIRNVLLPNIEEYVNADASAALNRLSELASADAAYMDGQAEQAFRTCAVKMEDTVEIDAQALLATHPAIAGRVILLAARELHVTQDVEYTHIRAVLRLAETGQTGSMANLSHNLCAQMEYGALVLGFTGREVDHSFEMRFDIDDTNVLPNGDTVTAEYVDECNLLNSDGYSECFDADKLPVSMMLRTRYNGDVVRPLNCGGTKKLKDYFIDKKLPRDARGKTPLLANGKNIVWVVGHTISDDYKVDEGTKRILNLKYIKKREEHE